MRGDEGEHFEFGLRAARLGIEQPTRHRSTPRTGIGPRPGQIPMSR
jgi:hypothetical protein